MKQHKCYVYTVADGFVTGVALHSPLHQSYWFNDGDEAEAAVDIYMLPTWAIKILEEHSYTYAWTVLGLDEPDEYPDVHLSDGYDAMSFIHQNGKLVKRNAHYW